MSLIDKKFLPSKKFTIIISTLLAIALVSFGIYYLVKNRGGLELQQITVSDIIKQDSNGDGIPDWQEKLNTLKQTNPQVGGGSNGESTNTTTPDTYTEQFAQDIFVTLAALSQDSPLDATAKENVSENLSSFVSGLNTSKVWTPNDITVIGNDPYSVSEYIKSYGIFIQRYDPSMSPIPILEKGMSSQNPSDLDGLDEIINHQKDALDGLRQFKVPEKIRVYHLAIMASIQGILDSAIGMKQYFTDPLLTFSAVILYNENIQNYSNAVNNINNDFFQKL